MIISNRTMRIKCIILILIATLTMNLHACSNNDSATADETEDEFVPQYTLPTYHYTGDDPIKMAIANYINNLSEAGVSGNGAHNSDYDYNKVFIPAPVIFKTVVQEDGTTLVYGNFWTFRYENEGSTLKCLTGWENPGVITLEEADGIYFVTNMEYAGDGYDKTPLSELCKSEPSLIPLYDSTSNRKNAIVVKTRYEFVREYISGNNLSNINSYHDKGEEYIYLFQ